MSSSRTIKSIIDEPLEEEDDYVVRSLSRLSIESEGDDADVEPSDDENESSSKSHRRVDCGGLTIDNYDKEHSLLGVDVVGDSTSMPGTPDRAVSWAKDYASETEAWGCGGGGGVRRRRHRRRTRTERWMERAWGMKKEGLEPEMALSCRVLVPSGLDRSARMHMDMEEVRACRDLGFELPADCTLHIPESFSDLTADTSSGGNSPIANWRISSPGDNPKDVKARLKLWAQAVALTSASRLSG